jgi:hypothetical protein
MIRLSVILLFLCVVMLGSCAQDIIVGHGSVKSEQVSLPSSEFDKVRINAPVDAHISVGGAPSLRYEGFANLLPYLHTEVRNRTLRIYVDDPTMLHTDKNIVAHISLPALRGLDLSGSSDASVSGPVNADEFNLDVSGAGAVDIQELHARSFNADMSGSTALVLGRGEIQTGNFKVSGNGAINSFGVAQQTTVLDLSGTADAEVNVATNLDVDISGSGSVAYKGHPSIKQEVSGSGTIRDAN